MNAHLETVQTLVRHPRGANLIEIKNAAGRSAIGEAELAGWDEGAQCLVGAMTLEGAPKEEETAEEVEDVDGKEKDPNRNVKIEIQDAEGRIAGMTLGPRDKTSSGRPEDVASPKS